MFTGQAVILASLLVLSHNTGLWPMLEKPEVLALVWILGPSHSDLHEQDCRGWVLDSAVCFKATRVFCSRFTCRACWLCLMKVMLSVRFAWTKVMKHHISSRSRRLEDVLCCQQLEMMPFVARRWETWQPSDGQGLLGSLGNLSLLRWQSSGLNSVHDPGVAPDRGS